MTILSDRIILYAWILFTMNSKFQYGPYFSIPNIKCVLCNNIFKLPNRPSLGTQGEREGEVGRTGGGGGGEGRGTASFFPFLTSPLWPCIQEDAYRHDLTYSHTAPIDHLLKGVQWYSVNILLSMFPICPAYCQTFDNVLWVTFLRILFSITSTDRVLQHKSQKYDQLHV